MSVQTRFIKTFSPNRRSHNREKYLGMAAVRWCGTRVGGVWGKWQGEKVSEMDVRSINSSLLRRTERSWNQRDMDSVLLYHFLVVLT